MRVPLNRVAPLRIIMKPLCSYCMDKKKIAAQCGRYWLIWDCEKCESSRIFEEQINRLLEDAA